MRRIPPTLTLGSLLLTASTACLLTLTAAEEPLQPPTFADVSYGPDTKQVMDVWLPPNASASPVVVHIHGGGWCSGDKSLKNPRKQRERLPWFLQNGIAFISIDYRLTGKGKTLPTPVHDAARAIQFIRSKAGAWKLDPQHIAIWGGSAGGCTCLWLLFHDDLADPNSADPIARESTRVCAAVVQNGQVSIDPKWLEANIGIEAAKHDMVCMAVGEESLEGVLAKYPQYQALFNEFSPLNHLDKNDPPYFGIYVSQHNFPAPNPGAGIHSGLMGAKMKEKSDAIGHTGYLSTTRDQPYKDEISFLKAMLLKDKKP